MLPVGELLIEGQAQRRHDEPGRNADQTEWIVGAPPPDFATLMRTSQRTLVGKWQRNLSDKDNNRDKRGECGISRYDADTPAPH
jgi:hypothetical protein